MANITTSVSNKILTIQLSKPKVNSLSSNFQREITKTFEEASNDPQIRGVLLKSAFPSSFCAGLDLKEVGELVLSRDRQKIKEFGFKTLYDTFRAPILCKKPVAASVNGHAIAGGLILALSCDYLSLGTGKSKTTIKSIQRHQQDHKISDHFELKGSKLGLTELAVGVPFPAHVIALVDRQLNEYATRKLCFDALLVNEQEGWNLGIGDVISSDPDLAASDWLNLVCQQQRPIGAFEITKQLWWKELNKENVGGINDRNVDVVMEKWVDQMVSEESITCISSFLSRL